MRRIFPLALILLAAGLSSTRAADGDADDKAIRDLTQRLFTAYAAKDLDAFMALWSEKSPDYDARKKIMAGLFAATGPIELKSLAVVRVRQDGDAASVRVRVQLAGNNLKTGKPHALLGRLDRVLDLAREGDSWKVMRYGPSDVWLMERLVETKSKGERLRLLDDDTDLIGPNFVIMVLDKGDVRAGRGRFDQASRIQDAAFEVADGLGDKTTLAWCHIYRGLSLKLQSRHAPALASYQKALALFREANDREGEGSALYNMGIVYADTDRYPEALQHYQDSLKIERDLKDRAGEADTIGNIGVVYEKTSRYAEALQQYQDCLVIKRERKDRAGEAITLLNIGVVYEETSRYADALQQYQDSLTIQRDLGNRIEEVKILNNIGNVYADTGRYAEALQQFQDSLKIERDLKDRAGEAKTLNNIGLVYADTGRYPEALQQYQDCLTIKRDLGDRAGRASTLNNIGIVYEATGGYAEALQQYQDSLKITRDLGDRAGAAGTLTNMGTVYEETARYPEALQQYQDSLKIQRDLGARAGEAAALLNIGNVYKDTSRYPEALRQFQDSLKITRALGDRAGEARALINIGNVYKEMGRYGEALRQHQDGLTIERDLGARPAQANTLNNIGIVYEATGRYAEALQQHHDSLKITRELKDRVGEARALHSIGIVYEETDRYAEALQQFQDCLKIRHDLGDRAGEAATLEGVGIVYEETGRYPEALQQYQDSLKITRELKQRAGEARILSNIGVVYRVTKRYAEARQQFEEALGIAESIGDLSTAIYCHHNLGRTYQTQERWSDAAKAYGEAVGVAELLRTNAREPSLQTSLLAQKTGPFFRRAECLLELKQPAQAFAAGEQMKARGLVDLFRQGKADLRRGMSDGERKQEQALQDRLTALGVQLEDPKGKADGPRRKGLMDDLGRARQDLEAFRRDLYLHRPDLATRRAEFTPASLDDLGALFAGRPGLVVLSYLIGDDETLLFVLTPGNPAGAPARLTVHRIDVGAKDLAEAVDAFRAACADPAAAAPDSEELYRRLIAPAAGELRAAKQLVVVPDGVLHTLPFQALQDADGKHLVERFAVSYAPSVTALVKMEELGAARRQQYAGKPATLLAVGLSDFRGREEESRPLSAAEPEARAMADLFGAGGRTLLATDATRAKVQAAWSGRRYLHFATHGRLNPDAPLYSALVLSPGDANDGGVLYAEDLVNADVPAELAVMSACETGLGRRVDGEGLLGLSWSWFAAGVPSTVASQWSVGDASTARLMMTFYARLAAGDSKAEALRQAELTLLKDEATRHPFYWAPFVLVGDDR